MANNQIPIENRTYNYFDDGKIRESRLYEAWITDIIPFKRYNVNDEKRMCDLCAGISTKRIGI